MKASKTTTAAKASKTKLMIDRASPAEVKAATRRQAKREGVTPAELMAREAKAAARHNVRGDLYRADVIGQAEPVTFEDDGRAVTIRVGGRAYANLAKIASALNALSWTDDDNSPASVLDFWVGSLLGRIETTPEEDATNSVTDLVFDFADGIDTGADDGTPEDASRRAELKAALQAIKF